MLAVYLWLPAELLAQTDPALMISGAAMFGTVLVYLIYRADRMMGQIWGEILVIGLICSGTVWRIVAEIANPVAKVGVSIAVLALWIYFSITLIAARAARVEAERAARRSVQAQKMEAIGQLAGGIAHHFNNILTAIQGNLELYEEIDDPEERDRFVAEARQASRRAAGLVQHLLAYSRKTTMSLAVHGVGALIEEVRALTQRLLPSSILLEVDLGPEAAGVAADGAAGRATGLAERHGDDGRDPGLVVAVDQAQFVTALVNLVVNARDAMQGAGRITIRAGLVELEAPLVQPDGHTLPAGVYARIAVADTGPGIPPEILRRVTEPFFTTKPVGQGSGLGLSMVEGFARQSNGALVIASSSAGTEVAILLPRASADRVAQRSGQSGRAQAAARAMPGDAGQAATAQGSRSVAGSVAGPGTGSETGPLSAPMPVARPSAGQPPGASGARPGVGPLPPSGAGPAGTAPLVAPLRPGPARPRGLGFRTG